MKKVDIIVPVKNEVDNIEELVWRIHTTMSRSGIEYELIIVDDNSTDDSLEKIKGLAKKSPIILYRGEDNGKNIGGKEPPEHKSIYPIRVCQNKDKPGKAYCILEGVEHSEAEYVVMIDADLQYPPEAIPEMLKNASQHGVVVANRKRYKDGWFRKFIHQVFSYIFGNLLFGLSCDVQSGLKVFRREIIEHLDLSQITAWTFDLSLLFTARELGYSVGCIDITFERRKFGQSKVGFFKTSYEIGLQALKLRLRPRRIYQLKPQNENSMIGAGLAHKRQRFITHNILPHEKSAIRTLKLWHKGLIFFILLFIIIGFISSPLDTLRIVIAILSTIYFVDVLFNLYLIIKSLHFPPEITSSEEELRQLDNGLLPTYSILCPLYKEAHILPQFLSGIDKLDWPKNKLDVMLLLEEDDKETIKAAQNMELPPYVRTIVVPHSQPKTKPKACNYGLSHARGEYFVIYDAEDIPDPLQLKKAYLAFKKVPRDVICLQAKLNYYNPHQNLLTRIFTAEYSLWFDVILSGLQSIETSIPLGGTSNHFRTKDLINLHGWDSFNVTEDCDLGIRLFKEGYKTAIIDSITLEEANSEIRNWIRQRSRWIKGYMQTYFVHLRGLLEFAETRGYHALIFQLIIGGKIAFIFITPVLWAATLSYFALYPVVGPTIESLYPPIVFYMALTSLVFGNFMYIYYYMIGCAKRDHWTVIKYVFLVPFYWVMISISAFVALYQLIFKPHYWEKTIHGLHLKKKYAIKTAKEVIPEVAIESAPLASEGVAYSSRIKAKLFSLIQKRALYIGGLLLIVSTIFSSIFNFLFNIYLGRRLDIADFGLLSLFEGLLYLAYIQFRALGATVNYRSGFLNGRYGLDTAFSFYRVVKKYVLYISLLVSGVWIMLTPVLMKFFHAEQATPFLLFTPIWVFGLLMVTNTGFLSGKLAFGNIAVVYITESIFKLVAAVALVESGFSSYVYAAIPLSMYAAFLISLFFISKIRGSLENQRKETKRVDSEEKLHFVAFPKKFYLVSLLSGISAMAFLSFDIVLARHYLSAELAGQYALVSLVGKVVFFLGSLASQFVLPLVSFAQGAKKDDRKTFRLSILATTTLTFLGFVVFGLFGTVTVPFLLGSKVSPILIYLPMFSFAMMNFAISRVFVSYYLAKKSYAFPLATLPLTLIQLLLIAFNHATLGAMVYNTVAVGILSFIVMVLLHFSESAVLIVENNLSSLGGLFSKSPALATNGRLRILILNWRDTRHVWAGGAELYIHEIARKFVKQGCEVTVFCGSDGRSPRNSVIDGVKIVRRGGFYTVYLWALIYYLQRFRKTSDIVIDCENGIPFFTPLYVRKPVLLLIHHIHQGVFRAHLRFPLSTIAAFLESKLMPIIYRNQKIITVSQSSKKEILKIGLAKKSDIEIVHPGINLKRFSRAIKTFYPSFVYLGRLKPYKNVDVIVKAFEEVVKKHPKARLVIAGEGESLWPIKKLVSKLGLDKKVEVLGKVSEKQKAELLSRSWVALQPSMVEGWGITVIEANACGTPVIASDVSGLRDSILNGRTGLLVKVRDVKKFTQAMDELITNKVERVSLSREAYAWSQGFVWEKSAKKFYEIIDQELRQKHRYSLSGELAVAEVKQYDEQ